MSREKLVRATDATYLNALEQAEREPGRRFPERYPGEGIVAVTARPTRQALQDQDWHAARRPVFTEAHRLILAKLAAHFEDIRSPSRVKRRRVALAWILDDVVPADPEYVASFAGLCEEFDLGLGWARRSALRQAVAAELARRQRFLIERGRTRLSLEPAVIEAELVTTARRILAKARHDGAASKDVPPAQPLADSRPEMSTVRVQISDSGEQPAGRGRETEAA